MKTLRFSSVSVVASGNDVPERLPQWVPNIDSRGIVRRCIVLPADALAAEISFRIVNTFGLRPTLRMGISAKRRTLFFLSKRWSSPMMI